MRVELRLLRRRGRERRRVWGLEACVNDEDFGLVRMGLGLGLRIEWGPVSG